MAYTWTESATPSTGTTLVLRGIVWAGSLGLFVAVGWCISGVSVARVLTSPDGVTWTLQNASEANHWRSVAWSPTIPLLVAVSSTGTNRVMTSPDGVTWTARSASEANAWQGVAWSPSLGLFVAVANSGTHQVMTSPDGITWTNRTAAAALGWTTITWSPDLSLFVALAGGSAGTGNVMTSPDGITWTQRSTPVSTSFGSNNPPAWSPTLTLWAALSSESPTKCFTSPDGITWTQRTLPTVTGGGGPSSIWSAVIWDGTQFLGVGQNNNDRILSSVDGVTWTAADAGQYRIWDALAVGANVIVAADQSLHDVVLTGVGVGAPEILAVVPATGGTLGADPVRVIVRDLVTGATVTFDGTPATSVVFVEIAPTTIASSTVATATVITTTTPHGLLTDDRVAIDGHTGSTPAVDGDYTITRLSATKFSIPLTVTVAGSGGTVTPVAYLTCLIPAHAIGAVDVVVTNPDSTTDTLEDGFGYLMLVSTPILDAGQATVVTGPAPSVLPTTATVTRGLNNGTLTYAWTQVSGPAAATISDPTVLTPDLTFGAYVPGTYVFELAATTEDASLTTASQLTVVIAPTVPPRVTSGGATVAV